MRKFFSTFQLFQKYKGLSNRPLYKILLSYMGRTLRFYKFLNWMVKNQKTYRLFLTFQFTWLYLCWGTFFHCIFSTGTDAVRFLRNWLFVWLSCSTRGEKTIHDFWGDFDSSKSVHWEASFLPNTSFLCIISYLKSWICAHLQNLY